MALAKSLKLVLGMIREVFLHKTITERQNDLNHPEGQDITYSIPTAVLVCTYKTQNLYFL